jgi:hypothetical protein
MVLGDDGILQRHYPEDHDLNLHRCENLKSRNIFLSSLKITGKAEMYNYNRTFIIPAFLPTHRYKNDVINDERK